MSEKEKAKEKAELAGRIKKTDFYTRALSNAEKLDFETAAGASGLDDEITLIRLKIRKLIEDDPDKVELVLQATETLAKLVKTRYSINKEQGDSLAAKIKTVMKEIGVPLGVSLINKL